MPSIKRPFENASGTGPHHGGPENKRLRRLRSGAMSSVDDTESRSESPAQKPREDVMTLSHSSSMLFEHFSGDGPAAADRKKLAELFRTDLITAMKVPDYDTLDLKKCLVITDPWRNEWNRGVQVPVRSVDELPKARCRVAPNAVCAGNVKMPKKLIRISKGSHFDATYCQYSAMPLEADKICRYNLDDLDVRWLAACNRRRLLNGETPLDELTIERIIECFENAAFEQLRERKLGDALLGIEYDEDTVCNVCQQPDSEDNNEMLFCDACNVAVHQVCYGIPQIPTGKWYCRPCASGVKPTCLLCGKQRGAMKSTRSGQRWAHVSCSLWIPEVTFGDAELMEPVMNIAVIPPERWTLRCTLCQVLSGACIQCSARNCRISYHVTCAQQHGLQMKIAADDATKDDVKMLSYCRKHSQLMSPARKNADGSPSGSVGSSEEKMAMTKERAENIKARRLEELEDEFHLYVTPEFAAEKLAIPLTTVGVVFEYWKLKRKANFNQAFMRTRFEEEELKDTIENLLQRKIQMLIHLRQNLETARNLCYMIERREKLKRSWCSAVESVVEKECEIVSGSFQRSHPSNRDFSWLQRQAAEAQNESVYDAMMRARPMDEERPSTSMATQAAMMVGTGRVFGVDELATKAMFGRTFDAGRNGPSFGTYSQMVGAPALDMRTRRPYATMQGRTSGFSPPSTSSASFDGSSFVHHRTMSTLDLGSISTVPPQPPNEIRAMPRPHQHHNYAATSAHVLPIVALRSAGAPGSLKSTLQGMSTERMARRYPQGAALRYGSGGVNGIVPAVAAAAAHKLYNGLMPANSPMGVRGARGNSQMLNGHDGESETASSFGGSEDGGGRSLRSTSSRGKKRSPSMSSNASSSVASGRETVKLTRNSFAKTASFATG